MMNTDYRERADDLSDLLNTLESALRDANAYNMGDIADRLMDSISECQIALGEAIEECVAEENMEAAEYEAYRYNDYKRAG